MAHGLAGSAGGGHAPTLQGIEIEGEIGRGGMGAVYLGRQRSLNREVAVKVLAPELADDPVFLQRLEREARVMAGLRHPNIVAVHDFHQTPDGAAIVMEFIEGGSLREKLLQHPQGLPPHEAIAILRHIAAGLSAAHASGVIHRDVKPENVLLDGDGHVRVTDFGLALPLQERSQRLTLTSTAAGTVDYMAPEQFKGGDPDPRLDLFALGVIAYELLTGHTPRGSFDPPHHLRPEVPEHVGRAVMRALRPSPAERFGSIDAFIVALDHGGRKPWPWRWMAAGVVITAAAGLGVWAGSNGPGDPPETIVAAPPPREWRDAVAGVRIYDDVIRGDWKNEDGVLTSNDQLAVISLESSMPAAYDVRMRFTRLEGRDSVCLFFMANGALGCAELDAWREGLAGVQEIGGEDLRTGYGFRCPIENHRSYEMLVEVRPDLVRMTIDGMVKKEFRIDGRKLTVPMAWEWSPANHPTALAIGSYQSSTRFEKIEWREVVQVN